MNRSERRIVGCGALLLAAAFAWVTGVTPGSAQAPAGGQGGPGAEARPKAAAKKNAQRRSFLISRDVPDPAAVERGQKLFVSNCGFCHGSTARGGENGPDLVRSVLALRDEGGDLIGPVIRQGVPDKGMPPLPLNDEQIADIAAFIRGQQQAAINRRDYEIQNVVTGDARQGEAFFNGAGGCKGCHSPGGDLRGIAGKYDAVSLQSRFLYPGPRRFGPGSETPPPPVEVTVTPPSGAPVTGVLKHLDDFNVALRDSSGSYHSFTRSKALKVEVRDPLAAHVELLKKYTDDDMHNVLAYLVTLQ
jgi:mono/diheme cytochrome c family protein